MYPSKMIYFVLFILLMQSCIKRIDGPIDIPKSNYPTIEIDMGYNLSTYTKKVFYDIESEQVVQRLNSEDWDIGITTHPELEKKFIINYANGVPCNGFTKKTTDFTAPISEAEYQSASLSYAHPYDDQSSLFGDVLINGTLSQYVYYLNNGRNQLRKFQVIAYCQDSITIRYGSFNDNIGQTARFAINPSQNYTYFSFLTNSIIAAEPIDRKAWDIEFTSYTTLVTDFGGTQYYRVAGALYNPSKNDGAAKIENEVIENVSTQTAQNIVMDYTKTAIGYDWKKFSSAAQDGFYSIPKRTYILDIAGQKYAIQFIEFSKEVNQKLERGFPTFLQRKI
jgi:hypothetical protein